MARKKTVTHRMRRTKRRKSTSEKKEPVPLATMGRKHEDYGQCCIVFGLKYMDLFKRLRAIKQLHKISVSKLMVVCAWACIDTLEKEIPKYREFLLNGKKIQL